jgi:hypothetical protein
LAVKVTTLISLFWMSLHLSSPPITSCALFKPRSVAFISSDMTEMFSFLVFSHLCHIVHDLFLLITSFSFVYPCSSTRLQTVTGEFPSLVFIQLIEKCSLQWCRVVWKYVEICDLLEDVWERAEFCEQCADVWGFGLLDFSAWVGLTSVNITILGVV